MHRTSHPYCAFAVTLLASLAEEGCSNTTVSQENDFTDNGRLGYEDTGQPHSALNINPFASHIMTTVY